MEQSIILSWSKENIENTVPVSTGILMLRSTPVNGDIVDIRVSSNLKFDLQQLFDQGVSDGVKYFNWVMTANIESAQTEIVELKRKYHLS